MSQDYSELESQIGAMGDEEKPKSPGKLKHRASYGQKEELDSDEKQSLDTFLRKTKKEHDKIIEGSTPISHGWIPVDRSEMGSRSDFYPSDWNFYIKPAQMSAIKNWTAIDEERPDVVNNVFNEIIKTSLKIEGGDGRGISWTQINSWDRFWFILKVREYTFAEGESKIEFEDTCSECDTEITYNLTSSNLFYEFPDDDLIEKYWQDGKWVINPQEYGVDHNPIILFTPKLGKDEAVIDWATARARNKQKIDETFIKFLIWMLDKPAKDPSMLDRQIQKIYKEYQSWDYDMFSFMNDVVNNITINPSEKLRCICPNCGQEATSTVQFPNGIKILFTVESKVKKFGSR